MKKSVTAIMTSAILLFFLTGGCLNKPSEDTETRTEKPIPVKVASVVERDVWVTLTAVGTVKPDQIVQVKSKIPGKIVRLPVDEGSKVRKGEVLAVLDPVDYKLAVKNAKAALKAAQLSLKEAEVAFKEVQADWVRYRRLYNKKVIAKQKWDHMNAAYQKARIFKELASARVLRAKVALEIALTNLKNTKIYAPFNGIIAKRLVDPGDRVYTMPPTVLMVIMDLSHVKIVSDIPEKELKALRLDSPALVTFDAFPHRTFAGKVTKIHPEVDPVTRNFTVEVRLENPAKELRAGMFAHVKFTLKKIRARVIPRSALLKIPGTGIFYAFKLTGDTVQKVNLETGIEHDNLVQVIEGLKVGDKVVTVGNARLKTGKKIEIVQGDHNK